MTDISDLELLRNYCRQGSEAAFATLVQSHVNLVYSVAFRHVGIAAQAEEITQAVFVILARKAASLRPDTILEGWLHETARLTALSFRRGERRRQFREQQAYMESTFQTSDDTAVWNQLAPMLDEAISRLGKKDCDAVVLRFFNEKNLREVAVALNVTEVAAQRRVHRAVEKLRKFFAKRGVALSAAAVMATISANSVQAASAGLAKTVTALAVIKGATAGGPTLTLIKGALKLMAWTKAKIAVATLVGMALAAGTATVTIQQIEKHERENFDWQVMNGKDTRWLKEVPPLLKIVPTRFPNGGRDMSTYDVVSNHTALNLKEIGLGLTVKNLLEKAYHERDSRTVILTELPGRKYDFVVTVPHDPQRELQAEIARKFGLAGRFETIETNVLFLTVNRPDAVGLKPGSNANGYAGGDLDHLYCTNMPLSELASMLESRFEIPVIDGTALTNHFDFTVVWEENGRRMNNRYPDYPDFPGLKRALLDQLGLQLVPTNMPIEMLVVDKVK
jgi:uncharacterized protein (TIGR03435 family)